MKHLCLALGTALLFAVASMAQTSPSTGSSQGTQGSSPAMSSPSSPSGQAGTGNDSSMGQGSSTMGSEKGSMKGEKKLKGCIKSEGGNYMLEEKGGKSVPLSGADVSAHSGHEVTVHGSWENGGAMSESSSGSTMSKWSSGKSFNVTSVDMVSESCSMGKKSKSSGSMSGSDQPKQ